MTTSLKTAAPEIAVVTQKEVSVTGQEIKKKELVESIAESTGEKKAVVKAVVEACLEKMGAALAKGDVLNLQPLGKMQVFNEKDTPSATIYKCKVRQVKEQGAGNSQADADAPAADSASKEDASTPEAATS